MRVVIIYLIRGRASRYQSAIIKKLSRISGERYLIENPLPTHVTLKSPFEIRNLRELDEVIADVARKHKKAPLKIKGFGNFRKHVAFLKTYFSQKGRYIQRDLVNSIKHHLRIEPHEFDLKWKPHATVAYGNSKDTFSIIWNYLRTRNPSYSLEFDNITILKKPGKFWKIHRIYNIK